MAEDPAVSAGAPARDAAWKGPPEEEGDGRWAWVGTGRAWETVWGHRGGQAAMREGQRSCVGRRMRDGRVSLGWVWMRVLLGIRPGPSSRE